MVVLYSILGIMEVWPKLSPKNQLPNTILVPWLYWLGVTKPKNAFSMTLNALQNLKKLFYGIFYQLAACLMPSDKCNWIMAKTTSLTFSLFDVTSAQQVPLYLSMYNACILPLSSFASHFFLLMTQSVNL